MSWLMPVAAKMVARHVLDQGVKVDQVESTKLWLYLENYRSKNKQ